MADDVQITCASYTHARRHPLVLGKIGGWTPPFQLTLTQLAVLVAVYAIELKTWRWWASFLPTSAALLLALFVPALLAWLARGTRLEGRSLPRAAMGWIAYLSMPRNGRVGGRPYHPPRPLSLRADRVLVSAAPPE